MDANAGKEVVRHLVGAGANVALAGLSGVLASLLFVPHERWWVGWFCLVPLLVAVRRTTAIRAAGWLMLLYGIVFFACATAWLGSIFGPSTVGIYVIAALPLFLFGWLYRATALRVPGMAAALLAPVLFLAVEWIRCEGWYFQFSWGQLGFGMTAMPGGHALYPLIGVYGVTFLFVLVNALAAETVVAQSSWKRKTALWLPILGGVSAISGFFYTTTRHTMPVKHEAVLVQDETGVSTNLRRLTELPQSASPALIVWPEYGALDKPLSEEKFRAELCAFAKTQRATLVVCGKEDAPATVPVDFLRRRAMMNMDGHLFYNTALVIGPDGRVIGSYAKTHPIQFFSDGVPGRRFPAFPTPAGRLGVAICYDFDYASTALRLVHNGAEVLAVPTFDSREWPAEQHTQHARMAEARAAEVGRYVLRATSSGVSQLIDARGRTVASIPNGVSDAVVGGFTPQTGLTPYARWTWRLPYLCLGLSALWAAWLVWVWASTRTASRNASLGAE